MGSQNLPQTRSEWARLDWQEAQHAVANLLNQHGFLIFEEKRLANAKRSDVFVFKNNPNRVTFGIIEVKCYQKITRSLEKSAMKQAIRYLKSQFNSTINHRWQKKEKQYFAAVVYTKDYPASFLHHTITKYKRFLPKDLVDKYPLTLISSTPNTLIQKLEHFIGLNSKQTRVDDFF